MPCWCHPRPRAFHLHGRFQTKHAWTACQRVYCSSIALCLIIRLVLGFVARADVLAGSLGHHAFEGKWRTVSGLIANRLDKPRQGKPDQTEGKLGICLAGSNWIHQTTRNGIRELLGSKLFRLNFPPFSCEHLEAPEGIFPRFLYCPTVCEIFDRSCRSLPSAKIFDLIWIVLLDSYPFLN